MKSLKNLKNVLDSEYVRAVSNHPVHISSQNTDFMNSAFIPFCFIESNKAALGINIGNFSLPICQEFTPVVFHGRRCYEMDSGQFPKYIRLNMGIENSFTLVLDYNDDNTLAQRGDDNEAQIYINTLGRLL